MLVLIILVEIAIARYSYQSSPESDGCDSPELVFRTFDPGDISPFNDEISHECSSTGSKRNLSACLPYCRASACSHVN